MKRVLIVDDHDLFREVLATVLQLDTHLKQNVQAESLAEARQLLRGLGGNIDLAIVDADLPNGEGGTDDQGAARGRRPGACTNPRSKLARARPGCAGPGGRGVLHSCLR